MPQELGGDLSGTLVWGADLTGARFRDVNLTNVSITHAWLIDVEIDALVERVVINGVDVTDYVNEHDPWHPLRSMLRACDPEALRAAWEALEHEWALTIAMARTLPEARLHESVDGEWTFVETLRHVVFAIDKWLTVPVLGAPFHPMGLPNTGSVDFPWPGLEHDLRPSVDEALAVHADRALRVRHHLASLTPTDLTTTVDVLENGPHTVLECLQTVLEEAFWHNRYARRDLERLTRTT